MISRTHSQGEIEYVVAAVVVANVSSAFIIPVTLPFLIGTEVRISILEVLEPVFVGALLGGWREPVKTGFVIVMGVAGCGKTTVGTLLAKSLGWNFYDADGFHPAENVAKMAHGTPLDDADRAPWLAALNKLISASLQTNRPAVLACSALKESYRQQLLEGNEDVQLVYLKGSYELIWSRLSRRTDHYMKPNMLHSQFEALEEPRNALVVDISMPVEGIVQEILNHLEEPADKTRT